MTAALSDFDDLDDLVSRRLDRLRHYAGPGPMSV
jgi:hypothetical protein